MSSLALTVATAGGSRVQGGQLAFFIVHHATIPCFRAWAFLCYFHKSLETPKKLLTMGNTRAMMQSKARETPETQNKILKGEKENGKNDNRAAP